MNLMLFKCIYIVMNFKLVNVCSSGIFLDVAEQMHDDLIRGEGSVSLM